MRPARHEQIQTVNPIPQGTVLLQNHSGAHAETFVSLMSHAEELVDAGLVREARRLLAQFVERKQLDSRILPALAALYLRVGKPEHAVKTMRKAIEQGGENPDLHNTLGLIYALLGREAESRSEFEHALAIDPANPEALRNLAFILHRSGSRQQAYQLLIRCYHSTPLSVELRLICGTLLEMDGRHNEAADCYNEVMELSSVCEQVQLASQRMVSLRTTRAPQPFDALVKELAEEYKVLSTPVTTS